MEMGKLRNLNPAIVTMTLALTVIVQPEPSKPVSGSTFSRLRRRGVVDEYTQFWLKALMQLATIVHSELSPQPKRKGCSHKGGLSATGRFRF